MQASQLQNVIICISWCVMVNEVFHTRSETINNLEGYWFLRNNNNSIKVKSYVPGYVHTALMENAYIGDPYFRYNDENYRWIDYDNWTFSRYFTIDESMLNKTQIILNCEGLDTIAEVFINDVLIGHSTNMFHRHVWNIKKTLHSGINEIQIKFTSAVTYSAYKSSEYNYTIPPKCPPQVQHGECHMNLIRKKQCSFGWDWGPAFASQGIWRDISIQAFDSIILKDVMTTTRKGEQSWLLTVEVVFYCGSTAPSGIIAATLLDVDSRINVSCKTIGKNLVKLPTMIFDEKHPVQTWWPVGYGNQPLYNLDIIFKDKKTSETLKKVLRVGFREVELIQEEIPEGLTFYYQVNGVPIFIKGANWIPADSFEDRVTDDVIRNLLQSAVNANMNLVRNWGGGIYQRDSFYSIADELGLLVWQEFMFACFYYPSDPGFLDSVEREVEDQMQRLQYHPSILVWSGNNEIEESIADNWYSVKNTTVYKQDYTKLFIGTIREKVLQLDSSRPFVSSSPSNGLQTEKEGWLSDDPNSDHYGDVHYYNYTMDCWNVLSFPRPRFASEYGLQSMPQFHTLSTVTNEEDWSFSSPLMLHRQHHPHGNKQMLDLIGMHFKIPNSTKTVDNFKNLLYLSQISQAICIKAESEHYRRLLIGNAGKSRNGTMGAIYWQLNSIWPAPTWSSLEYGGKWKMLHYYVKDFFAPIIVSSFELNGSLCVFAISDKLEPITLSLRITIWAWQSMEPLNVIHEKVTIVNQSSVKIYQENVDYLLKSSSCDGRIKCVATLSMVDENEEEQTPRNVHYFSPFKDVHLIKPNIKIVGINRMKMDQVFLVTLQSEALAPFVWLRCPEIPGRFSSNGILITEQLTEVLFYSWKAATLADIENCLTVTSLYNIYNE